MLADIIKNLNTTMQQIKDLAADRDACLERARRAEAKCAEQKNELGREIAKVKNERDKLLKIIERNA